MLVSRLSPGVLLTGWAAYYLAILVASVMAGEVVMSVLTWLGLSLIIAYPTAIASDLAERGSVRRIVMIVLGLGLILAITLSIVLPPPETTPVLVRTIIGLSGNIAFVYLLVSVSRLILRREGRETGVWQTIWLVILFMSNIFGIWHLQDRVRRAAG